MRRLLIILALLPTMLWGQTSPALNTLTGPYRGPMSLVTPKTLKDSIDVLEARLLAAISDSTGLAFDSVYALSAALIDARNRYLADSTETARQLLARTDTTRFKADSARVADSLRVHAMRIDTLYCVWVTVNDTTSPGTFYAPDTITGRFVRADSSILRRARIIGVVVDSVNKGAKARIQTAGTVSFSWWNGLLGPVGSTVVNDSITACNPAPSDASRTNTLPMQALGTVLDSITIRLDLGEVWYYAD